MNVVLKVCLNFASQSGQKPRGTTEILNLNEYWKSHRQIQRTSIKIEYLRSKDWEISIRLINKGKIVNRLIFRF